MRLHLLSRVGLFVDVSVQKIKLTGLTILLLVFSLWSDTFKLQTKQVQLDEQEISILAKHFITYKALEILTPSANLQNKKSLELNFTIDKEQLNLSIEQFDIRSTNYSIVAATSSGRVELKRSPVITYSGILKNNVQSKVKLSIVNNTFSGCIDNGKTKLYIEPLRNFLKKSKVTTHILYYSKDAKSYFDQDRSEDVIGQIDLEENSSLAKQEKNLAEACKIAQISFAADYSMFQNYGSVEAVEQRILTVMNSVNTYYEDPRINLTYEITNFFIETSDLNTFGSTLSFQSNLQSLCSWAYGTNSGFKNSFDIPSLWWYMQGGGTIGIAGIGVVCNKTNLSGNVIKDYTKSLKNQVIDQTHELGHNWGANHINDNTDIMYPRVTGTNDKWTEPTVKAIVNFKNGRKCLDGCNAPPVAQFSVAESISCKGTVQFIDKSTHSPESWFWDFGDGTSSTEQNPIHDFFTNKVYTIKLVVSNPLGKDTLIKSNYLIINAPFAVPLIANKQCLNNSVTISASSNGTIKWYDTKINGSPIFIGQSFKTGTLTGPKVYYCEAGNQEFAMKKLGPADTSLPGGNGAFKEDAGDIWMAFQTLKPVRFVSITVYANKAGKRHFLLTLNNATPTTFEVVQDLPVGKSVVYLNWDLPGQKSYQLRLENTAGTSPDTAEGAAVYYNNLYRTRQGITFPQKIDSLVSVTGTYYMVNNPDQKGWYIGYDWVFQEINPCASARVPVLADPSCAALSLNALPLSKAFVSVSYPVVHFSNSLKFQANEKISMKIISFTGRTVCNMSIKLNASRLIKLPNLKRGIYLLQYEIPNQKSDRIKFEVIK